MDRILHFKSQSSVPVNSRHTTLPLLYKEPSGAGDQSRKTGAQKEVEQDARRVRTQVKGSGTISKDNFAKEEIDVSPTSSGK